MADFIQDDNLKKLLNDYYQSGEPCDLEWLVKTRQKSLEALTRACAAHPVLSYDQPVRARRDRRWDWITAGTAAAVLVGGFVLAQHSNLSPVGTNGDASWAAADVAFGNGILTGVDALPVAHESLGMAGYSALPESDCPNKHVANGNASRVEPLSGIPRVQFISDHAGNSGTPSSTCGQ